MLKKLFQTIQIQQQLEKREKRKKERQLQSLLHNMQQQKPWLLTPPSQISMFINNKSLGESNIPHNLLRNISGYRS